MRKLVVMVLASAFGVVGVGLATPAAATKWGGAGGAAEMCRARGSECMSFGTNNGVVACVDNRSSGQGVQCVQCKTGKDCTVLMEGQKGKWRGVRAGNVAGMMNNSAGKSGGPSTKETSLAKAINSASASLAHTGTGVSGISTSDITVKKQMDTASPKLLVPSGGLLSNTPTMGGGSAVKSSVGTRPITTTTQPITKR